jgi:predicted thioesterase
MANLLQAAPRFKCFCFASRAGVRLAPYGIFGAALEVPGAGGISGPAGGRPAATWRSSGAAGMVVFGPHSWPGGPDVSTVKDSLEIGLSRSETVTVDEGRSIDFLGENMRMYSTPSMVDDTEYACFRLLGEHLDEGESSVGIHVDMDHCGATPMGEDARVYVEVEKVDGRKVTFRTEIRDAVETVGRGHHTRFVIDTARHAERIADKRARF